MPLFRKTLKSWMHESLDDISDVVGDGQEKVQKQYKTRHQWFKDFREFFARDEIQKHRIRTIVIAGMEIDILYWLQLLLSVIIATLGLLINSTPVIIGAMLIAPLLQPIQAIPYAIATGRIRFYAQSLKILFLSILISLVGAYFITTFVPFSGLNEEILARTTPTILDLGIAFASGAIAFLVLGYKRLSGTIVGAAIAASLLPPLCATGVGLAMLNREVTQGTFLLFLANLIAIVLAGLLFFFLFGFSARRKDGRSRSKTQAVIMFVTAVLVAIPLRSSFQQINQNIRAKEQIQSALQSTIPGIHPSIEVLEFEHENTTDAENIRIHLKVPGTIKITQEHKNTLSETLAVYLGKPVNVSMEILETTSVYVPELVELSLEQQVEQFLRTYFVENYDKVFLIDVSQQNIGGKQLVALQLYTEQRLDSILLKRDIAATLQEIFEKTFTVSIDLQKEEEQKQISQYEKELQTQFGSLFPDASVQAFQVKQTDEHIRIDIDFKTVRSAPQVSYILQRRKESILRESQKAVDLEAKVGYMEVLEL